jgi:GTP-binding protein Era
MMAPFKSGFVSILGRPNVGKSTLFNRILGEKIAIVTEKPQTTRNRILGIKNVEGGQFIFLDTPGIHKGRSELNRRMVSTAITSGLDADVLLFMIEAPSPLVEEDRQMIESLRGSHGVPFLSINKIDLVKKEVLLPIIDQYQRLYAFEKIIPISAVTGEGVDILLGEILKYLPESPPYYPEEMVTDQTERFLVSEIVREKVIQYSYQEIPYSTAVTIDEFKEHPEKNLVVIKGRIHVEKNSQKKILIGKGGQKLRKIGETARKEIEALLERRVFLELWVNVEKNWTQDSRTLDRLGYPPTLTSRP